VPVGLTRFHTGGCVPPTQEVLKSVLERVTGWQVHLRDRLGVAFAYLSDEWYLGLGQDVPPSITYDGLDLAENGVGLVRRFLDIHVRSLRATLSGLTRSVLVTGTLFAPVLRRAVGDLPRTAIVPVTNRFFGETITVAGLLLARDVIKQLPALDPESVVLLPTVMFGGPGGQSLDGMTPEDVAATLDRRVLVPE
jgi:NifB/MoaA-like Fe-S oxidoreductase